MLKALAQEGVYERILGLRASRLAPEIRRVHVATGTTRAEGRFTLRRGRARWARMLAAALRLPREADDVAVTLEIERSRPGVERWTRRFGDRSLRSVQEVRDGLLVERFGPLTLSFRLEVTGGALRHAHVGTCIAGIRLPPYLVVDGTVRGCGGRMHVAVRTRLFGTELLSYRGWIA